MQGPATEDFPTGFDFGIKCKTKAVGPKLSQNQTVPKPKSVRLRNSFLNIFLYSRNVISFLNGLLIGAMQAAIEHHQLLKELIPSMTGDFF